MRSTYLLINFAMFIFPFLLSFDRKVSFWKKWKYIFPSLLIAGTVFIIWDIWATQYGKWSFNEKYILGYYLFNLPLEEILFFITAPYGCLFIYECVNAYLSKRITNYKLLITRYVGIGIGLSFFVLALVFFERLYTFSVFIAVGLFLILCTITKPVLLISRNFWIFICISYLPFLIFNYLLTSIPVVLYNNNENLGIRVTTIPIEDFFYSFALLGLNVLMYEIIKNGEQ